MPKQKISQRKQLNTNIQTFLTHKYEISKENEARKQAKVPALLEMERRKKKEEDGKLQVDW